MKAAAVIFSICGLGCLGWGLVLAISAGSLRGLLVMTILAGALLYQAYALFRSRPRSHIYGAVSCAALALGFGTITVILVLPYRGAAIPRELWSTVGATSVVAVTFAAALVTLLVSTREP